MHGCSNRGDDSISNMAAMDSHLENLFSTSSPEPLVGLSWNLVWSIGATSRCMVVQIVVIQYPIWPPWRPSWKSNLGLLLQNRLSDWAEIWCGALGQRVGSWLFKSFRSDIQYGRHGGHLENLFLTSSRTACRIELKFVYRALGQLDVQLS